MDSITYSKARNRLSSIMEQVCDTHDPVVITRQKADSVVLISLEDYKALAETAHLLRVQTNAWRLLESIAELERGGGTVHALAE